MTGGQGALAVKAANRPTVADGKHIRRSQRRAAHLPLIATGKAKILPAQGKRQIELSIELQDFAEGGCFPPLLFRRGLSAKPAGTALIAHSGIESGVAQVMAMLQTKLPGRRLPPLNGNLGVVNEVALLAG